MGKAESYPLVSVVIPTYNRALLLEKAMRSVLQQTMNDLELIIADDGSTDDTEKKVTTYPDPRVRYLHLEHSSHIGITRNAGVRNAKGKWIAFLDSDDAWHPRKLEIQLGMSKKGAAQWCYCGFRHVNEKGQEIPARAGKFRALDGWITKELLQHNVAAIVCSLLVEKSLFDISGGFSTDPRLSLRGDYEFVLRLSQLAPACAIPAILVDVLEHDGRVTRSVTDPFARSMMPYLVFLETQQDPVLREIARTQVNRLIREQHKKTTRSQSFLNAISKWSLLRPFKAVKLP